MIDPPMLLLSLPALSAETHFAAVPNAGYDSDDGLGFGARLEVTRVADGIDPYLASIVMQGYATLEGYQHYKARFDLPHLGQSGEWRLSGNLGYRRWENDGWWGLGNFSVRQTDTADNFHRYRLIQPYLRLTLSRTIAGPLSLFGAVEGKWSAVTAAEGTLLAEEQPFGMEGGWTVQGIAGLRVDVREPEVTPEAGGLFELAGRYAPPLPGRVDAGSFGGLIGSLRWFWTLAPERPRPRFAFGARVMAEYLAGEVPFYEMVQWSGWIPVSGMGGSDTLRGVSFGRLHGPGKAVLNTELRIDVLEHSLFRRPMRWQVVPFADSGLCFGVPEADRSVQPPGGAWPVTHGVGAGVRAIFDTTLVGRVDVAAGWDRVQDGDDIQRSPDLGIYLVFDHTF